MVCWKERDCYRTWSGAQLKWNSVEAFLSGISQQRSVTVLIKMQTMSPQNIKQADVYLNTVRTMDTTYLHIGMILSTLGLSPHGFALGLYPKGLIPMEIFVHPYIPMILPISSQCGTLVVYPTILPSNKGPPSLPSNWSFIRPLSTNQDSSFSTSSCWGQDTSMKHPESTTWLESFCSF